MVKAFAAYDNLLAISLQGGDIDIFGEGDGVLHRIDMRVSILNLNHEIERFEVNSLAFSADGQVLAVAREDRRCLFYDVATWECIHEMQPDVVVTRVAFSCDGALFAVGDDEGVLRLWPWPIPRPEDEEPVRR